MLISRLLRIQIHRQLEFGQGGVVIRLLRDFGYLLGVGDLAVLVDQGVIVTVIANEIDRSIDYLADRR